MQVSPISEGIIKDLMLSVLTFLSLKGIGPPHPTITYLGIMNEKICSSLFWGQFGWITWVYA